MPTIMAEVKSTSKIYFRKFLEDSDVSVRKTVQKTLSNK